MSVYPTKFVKLKNKKTGETYIYEVAQVIYSDVVLGVACITKHGIQDFYFTDFQMVPIGLERNLYDFKH
jgi:hypothetical protein